MNMLIGVLCEVVSAVSAAEKEEAAINLVKTTILVLLKQFDEDCSGSISSDELTQVMLDPQAIDVLEHLDIDMQYLQALQGVLFAAKDEVAIEDIIEMMLLCRGDFPTTVQHLILSQRYMAHSVQTSVAELSVRTESMLQTLSSQLHRGDSKTSQHPSRRGDSKAASPGALRGTSANAICLGVVPGSMSGTRQGL
eukprot:gnl/TRDRNA2_/TRDRNA2_173818_c8_seq1.p1 gnl/TRDRNA2_/TRDRNA2_173818_c8~~gnl/TRDRNA2_/TRDRNA2_173818_c8_seq1.p1  ORF type:complete len:195 (+),score=31.82 gnl/TRDRNA2_/TRDRNA2_173818_c8_seq1:2-586(+)